MIGEAGYFTELAGKALDEHDRRGQGHRAGDWAMAPILALSEIEAAMRESRIKRTKTVCTYCGVGCSFDIWTKDRHILKIEPHARCRPTASPPASRASSAGTMSTPTTA